MKKLVKVSLSVLMFGLVVGCGSSSPTSSNLSSGQCAAGMTFNGTTCVVNANTAQVCTGGAVWNGSYCVAQNTVNTVPGTVSQYPQQTQCPSGTYFNGATCAAIIVQNNGNCQQQNQVYTQNYGCANPCNTCQSQYSYSQNNQQHCVPVAVTVEDDYYYENTRSSNRGCRSGCNSNHPRKIVYRRDGTIRRIRW